MKFMLLFALHLGVLMSGASVGFAAPTSQPVHTSYKQPKDRHPTLARIARYLKRSAPKMKKMGFDIDDSYCHIGAAYSAAYLSRIGVEPQLFQPRSHHMLVYFWLGQKQYFIDQTMAQFFKKKSKAHALLMKRGGFFGTKDDFKRFYRKYIDDVKAWGDYLHGGYSPRNIDQVVSEIVTYEMWEQGTRWKAMNTPQARTDRVIFIWYNDFVSDSSHKQSAGLLWSAKYYYHIFHGNFFAVGKKTVLAK
ncbi:MAG: hypothetical protein CL920_25940 [Deltaproteobacteria bacterium]|nr:hypothetical protein [Deltaproteobacteria bacterium]|tara:strand:+ start:1334 stop:2077 length:744 start_codon:yes stop_codon:yes gene_type:complete